MSPSDLLDHYKTKAAAGAAIAVDRQAVQGWFDRGRIPLDQQMKYEVATDGFLKADVTAEFRDLLENGRGADSRSEAA